MSQLSKIEWTDATWNPVAGCSKISPGCKNCYAMRQVYRMAHNPNSKVAKRYEGLTQIVNGQGPQWTGKVRLNEAAIEIPLHWKKPRRIFVNSLSDLFHEDLPFHAIDDVFDVMIAAYWHTYQILTKRGEVMYRYFDSTSNRSDYLSKNPRIWLGVSAEDQERADERIPWLLKTPAAVRFVSYEPALGPVDFSPWLKHRRRILGALEPPLGVQCDALDWIIVGGESGPGARPLVPEWVRGVRDQCQAAGVAFFFKQWGCWTPYGAVNAPARQYRDVPVGDGTHHRMFRVPKHIAGAKLDGREWREMPDVVRANATRQSSEDHRKEPQQMKERKVCV